ncbi:MAG: polysaccharide deacetylase family protein [Lentisphaeria bacterium]|nr:polysaccharide deacetylase family protein [Lentisphaeria bacterium]MBR7145055.1 polysaccharide deacetylase family protein [Lentisphaeria bacterium]
MKKFMLLLMTVFTLFFCHNSFASAPRRGAVCFTFDDYFGNQWLKADSIFKKYDAHATFFIVREITAEKAEVMKKLQAAGHTVGLHTRSHRNADPLPKNWDMDKYIANQIIPQLEACKKYNIKVRSMAYPNNRRTEKTDQALFKYFDYLRAGWGKSKQPIFTPLAELPDKMVLGGGGIGTYYKSDLNKLKELLTEAHKRDALIVFFSHNIKPGARSIHMPTEMLEALLKHARELNMDIVGAEELPALKKARTQK